MSRPVSSKISKSQPTKMPLTAVGFFILLTGTLLILLRRPGLDIVGIVAFFAGLLLPWLEIHSPEKSSPPKQSQDRQVERALDVSRLVSIYVERADKGNPLAIPWLIELSKDDDPAIRLICITGWASFRQMHPEIRDRLLGLEHDASQPHNILEAARSVRAILEEWTLASGQ